MHSFNPHDSRQASDDDYNALDARHEHDLHSFNHDFHLDTQLEQQAHMSLQNIFPNTSAGASATMPVNQISPFRRPLLLRNEFPPGDSDFQTNRAGPSKISTLESSAMGVPSPSSGELLATNTSGYSLSNDFLDMYLVDSIRSDMGPSWTFSDLFSSSGDSQMKTENLTHSGFPETGGSHSSASSDFTSLSSSSSSSSSAAIKYEEDLFAIGLNIDNPFVLDENMQFKDHVDASSTNSTFISSSPLSGLIADVNMFDKSPSRGNVFVRPQDLMGSIISEAGSSNVRYDLPPEDEKWIFPNVCDIVLRSRQVESDIKIDNQSEASRDQSETSGFMTPHTANPFVHDFESQKHGANADVTDHSDDIHATWIKHESNPEFHTSSVQTGLFIPRQPTPSFDPAHIPERRPLAARMSQFRIANKASNVSHPRRRHTFDCVPELDESVPPCDVILYNNHLGIHIDIVAMKTAFFRLTHPGEKLAEDLLFSFAGRLSPSGDQISGYRCYIENCSKTTKRKDHMADHIRTHLGEKPFRCSICGLGFIRNNDCQRHENNHRPDKRFVCDCLAAFSRRDLFVRHQKTACAMSSSRKNTVARRKRKAGQADCHIPCKENIDDFDFKPDFSW